MNKDAARSPKTKKDADAALPDQGFFNAGRLLILPMRRLLTRLSNDGCFLAIPRDEPRLEPGLLH